MINAISRHRKTYKKPEQNQGKPFNKKISQCKFCGNDHLWKKELCPAFNKTCSNCGKLNHFRKQCRLPVKRRDEANCIYAVSSKIASIKDIAKENQVTINTRYGKLTLNIDIGTTCNVIP